MDSPASKAIREPLSTVPVLDVPFVGRVAVEDRVQDAVALGVRQELPPVADQAPGGDGELQPGVGAAGDAAHVPQLPFALAQLLDDRPGELVGHVDIGQFHGFRALAVLVRMVEDLRLADGELIALPAHVLD